MPHALQQTAPIEVRRQRRGALQSHRMIDREGIALVHIRHGTSRQPHLQGEHGFGLPFGRRLRIAQQFEHAGDMQYIFAACGGEKRLALQVVIAVGQAKAALQRQGDGPGAVLEVLHLTQLQGRRDADQLQPRKFRLQLLQIPDRDDAVELRLQGRTSGRVDALLVHTAAVEVGQLALHAALRARRQRRQ